MAPLSACCLPRSAPACVLLAEKRPREVRLPPPVRCAVLAAVASSRCIPDRQPRWRHLLARACVWVAGSCVCSFGTQGLLLCANPLDYAIGVWYSRKLVLQDIEDNPSCGLLQHDSPGCFTAAEAFGVSAGRPPADATASASTVLPPWRPHAMRGCAASRQGRAQPSRSSANPHGGGALGKCLSPLVPHPPPRTPLAPIHRCFCPSCGPLTTWPTSGPGCRSCWRREMRRASCSLSSRGRQVRARAEPAGARRVCRASCCTLAGVCIHTALSQCVCVCARARLGLRRLFGAVRLRCRFLLCVGGGCRD
jgi:hypothetical protein